MTAAYRHHPLSRLTDETSYWEKRRRTFSVIRATLFWYPFHPRLPSQLIEPTDQAQIGCEMTRRIVQTPGAVARPHVEDRPQ
ncbi:MAG TPA: hypothetical protein VFB50_21220, partial [Chloroflexota bacterium]|nr:hypothetical protein [Chloroflexota bacterium]